MPGGADSDEMLAIEGGEPVRHKPWPTYEHGTGPFDPATQEAVASVLASGRLFRYDTREPDETNAGQLESGLTRYFGSCYAIGLCSGTAALTTALLALDLPAGAAVACPAFGFPATASAILLAGLKPVLVGIDSNLHMDVVDVSELGRRCGAELAAIVLVHMRGLAAPINDFVTCAAELEIPLIEDAIPALGCEYEGRKVGTFGVAGCFSMQSDKTINTGEGGFLITNDAVLHERAVLLAGAFEGRYRFHLGELQTCADGDLPLYNFRIDELRAALAREQLLSLDDRVRVLRRNYARIVSEIEPLGGLRVRRSPDPEGYLGDSLVFFVDPARAEWVADALTAEGVTARNFGSTVDPNARAFWTWRFMGGHKTATVEALHSSVDHLRAAIDVSLSPRLTEEDIVDCVTAIRKVVEANAYQPV
jgi:dTDP-4-amino-4,6-dideoxygalactose transaminase